MKKRLFALLLPLAFAAPAAASTQAPEANSHGAQGGQWSADVEPALQSNAREGNFGHRRRDSCPPPRTARGHYEFVTERVWIEGRTRRVYVPAKYRTILDDCGFEVRILVRAAYYKTVCDPGYYETRTRRVWVPARPVITPGRGHRDTPHHRNGRFGRRHRR